MDRLKAGHLAITRKDFAMQQNNRCALCGLPFTEKAPNDPVLDHDHRTGAVRGVLHRGCNALLGKVENNAPRYGVRNIGAWGSGLGRYLMTHAVNVTGLLHPTYRTEEEKRDRRNMRARKARAAKKETA